MQVYVNGTQKEVSPGTRLCDLLTQMDLVPQRVAVELNLKIIDRKDYGMALQEGDKIEMVHFVGGGR